jgi:hypothetical protein
VFGEGEEGRRRLFCKLQEQMQTVFCHDRVAPYYDEFIKLPSREEWTKKINESLKKGIR